MAASLQAVVVLLHEAASCLVAAWLLLVALHQVAALHSLVASLLA